MAWERMAKRANGELAMTYWRSPASRAANASLKEQSLDQCRKKRVLKRNQCDRTRKQTRRWMSVETRDMKYYNGIPYTHAYWTMPWKGTNFLPGPSQSTILRTHAQFVDCTRIRNVLLFLRLRWWANRYQRSPPVHRIPCCDDRHTPTWCARVRCWRDKEVQTPWRGVPGYRIRRGCKCKGWGWFPITGRELGECGCLL